MIIKNKIHKTYITIIFLLVCLTNYAQKSSSVIIEGKMSHEEIRRQKVRDKIRVLEKSFYKDKRKFDNLNNNIRRTGSFSSFKKEDIVNFISRCDKALQYANSMNLDRRHKEIVALYKSVGIKKRLDSFDGLIKNIKRFKFNANNELNEKIKKDKKGKSTKLADEINNINHKKKIDKLNKESKQLDDLLSKRKKKTKSFEEVLKLSKKKPKSLSSLTSKKLRTTKTLFNKKSSAKNLSTKLKTIEPEKVDFKITHRGGYTGVIDGRGKTLIPFRKWGISEYKYSIAKVHIPFDTFKCSAFDSFANEYEYPLEATAYKVGYVDDSGRFIDGYEVTASGGGIKKDHRLFLRISDVHRNESEDEHRRRIYKEEQSKRIREERKRKKEAAKKKCENEVKRWKLRVTSRY